MSDDPPPLSERRKSYENDALDLDCRIARMTGEKRAHVTAKRRLDIDLWRIDRDQLPEYERLKAEQEARVQPSAWASAKDILARVGIIFGVIAGVYAVGFILWLAGGR